MIEEFWQLCLNHDIKSRDQLLREAVRVVKMKQYIDKLPSGERTKLEKNPNELFDRMQEKIGKIELGHFPGDRELFYRLYHAGKELNLAEYGLQTIRQDRVIASLQAHSSILQTFREAAEGLHQQNWLIVEAEKFMEGLAEYTPPSNVKLTLLTENYILGRLLKTYFAGMEQIQILQGSIYQPLPLTDAYDAILAVPNFGLKLDDEAVGVREAEGAALHHLAPLLTPGGCLTAILPARMMFQSGSIGEWRKRINELIPVGTLYTLPEGLFRPYTSVKTYLVTFNSGQPPENIQIGRYTLKGTVLEEQRTIQLKAAAFQQLEDWRIELLLEQSSDTLAAFQQAAIPKMKLRAVADIFRGKSILKQDLRPGSIAVLNISNLEDGEVKLEQLETIDEEQRKVKRYEVLPGDLVMTCRGTQTKLAVFPEYSQMVIVSANMIVIRFNEQVDSLYAKIFLESPAGMALIQSFQRGTTVMNLNPADVGEIEIPFLPLERQKAISEAYRKEKQLYSETVQAASRRWEGQREQIYSALY
ncbi:restriction endonuclease subunit S [Paenibacillus sp. JX-17]|uniref:Restriction endonuclease subunit S n=1 Tax=Paenibacillus lacisoli TaxID=3064525 RepID=A0ABT9CE84_9BACL|nr:restriction endonuclease subunit S [Paenibacillus sp. JX-17]MDO7907575.1 restriction endonuclease subunit S [Paenibacillus sp. JX-17]